MRACSIAAAILVLAYARLSGANFPGTIDVAANKKKELQAHCVFGNKGIPGKVAGLIELFQELGPRAAPGVQVIGELALMGGEGEKMRQRYRIFVHVSGRLGHGCGDAGGVLDWAGMQATTNGAKLGEVGTFATDDIALIDFQAQRLSLHGQQSIIGRSLVIHGPKEGSPDVEVPVACCRIVQGPVRPRKSTNRSSSSGGGSGNDRDNKNCCSGDNRDCCHHGTENRQGNLRRAAETTQRLLTVTPFRTVHQQQNSTYSTTKSTSAPQQHSTTTILKATPVDIPPAKETTAHSDPLREYSWVEKEPNTFVGVKDPTPKQKEEMEAANLKDLHWVQKDEKTFVAVLPSRSGGPKEKKNKHLSSGEKTNRRCVRHCKHHHHTHKETSTTVPTTMLHPTPVDILPLQTTTTTTSTTTSTPTPKLGSTTEPKWTAAPNPPIKIDLIPPASSSHSYSYKEDSRREEEESSKVYFNPQVLPYVEETKPLSVLQEVGREYHPQSPLPEPRWEAPLPREASWNYGNGHSEDKNIKLDCSEESSQENGYEGVAWKENPADHRSASRLEDRAFKNDDYYYEYY